MINILHTRKLKLQRNSVTCSKSHLFILANLGFKLSSILFTCQCLFHCLMPSFLLYNLADTIALVFLLTSLIQSLLATYFSAKLTNLSVSSRSLRAGNISYSSFYSQPQNLAPCMAYFSSVQFSCSVMSNSLQSHEPQYAKPPCPSPTPRVHPNPCPSSQ